MDLHPIILRRVEMMRMPESLTSNFATVDFEIALGGGIRNKGDNTLRLTFEVMADHGLDAAVAEAMANFQLFAEDLVTAVKESRGDAPGAP